VLPGVVDGCVVLLVPCVVVPGLMLLGCVLLGVELLGVDDEGVVVCAYAATEPKRINAMIFNFIVFMILSI